MTETAVLTLPAVILKVAEESPAATVTLAGTLAALGFELESDTTTPPAGAAPVSATRAYSDRPPEIVPELNVIPLSATAGFPVGSMVTLAVLFTPE